jgi:hypothetical protein
MFLDSVDGVSFHALLWSETEFRRHLLVVLQTVHLPAKTCIQRTAGGAAEILSWIEVEHGN